jgi:hypothetical protein
MCILVSPQQLRSLLTRPILPSEVCFRLVLPSALVLPLPLSLVVRHQEGKFARRSIIEDYLLTSLQSL